MVKKITIVKVRVNQGRSSDSGSSGEVKSVTNATEVKNVVMVCARKGGYL